MSQHASRILIVDDDAIVADSIAEFLADSGYESASAHSASEASELLQRASQGASRAFQVMIVDMSMPGTDGMQLIKQVRNDFPGVVPIVITGYGTIEQAVKAIRCGAVDYLTKPLVDEELRIAVEKALRQQALVAENVNLRHQLDEKFGLDNIVGSDPRMRRIYDVIEAVAPSKTTVLMAGESGTGKSLIARAIHGRSPRSNKPFVEISCGSIPETLLESELFGHTKGAFTGAHADKAGRFLAADGGTLFLDEINSASPGMQLKLLRVLQERSFEPVGSNQSVNVDVRVILASNQPLEELVASGEFRQDLYYRINVVLIELPPLRERVADIPMLAEHFLMAKAAEVSRQMTGITDDAMDALRGYAFPGNVRELENVIERAVVLSRSPRLTVEDLPPHVLENSTGSLLPEHMQREGGSDQGSMDWLKGQWTPMPLRDALIEPERQIILAALEANEWNRSETAKQLDINRTTLYKKIKQYGLEQMGRVG